MQWWTERTGREKLLIAAMGFVLLTVGLFQFVYKPLQAYHVTAERRLDQAAALFEEIASGARQVQALRATTEERGDGDNRTLRTTVTVSAFQANLTITRLEPEGTDGLNVWIEEADVQTMQRWLVDLSREHRITVRKATIRRREEGSAVRAQFLFSRSGGA